MSKANPTAYAARTQLHRTAPLRRGHVHADGLGDRTAVRVANLRMTTADVFRLQPRLPVSGANLGDPRPIQNIRRQIIPRAQGTVLEIGVGAGANFIHYDPTRVRKLYALEPNAGMIRLAKRPALLHQHGFSIGHIEAGYLARFPKAPSFCWWGTAERTDNTKQRLRFH